MRYQLTESRFLQCSHCLRAVRQVFLFRFGAPGISGEKRKRIGADFLRRPNHPQVSGGCGQMTSNVVHYDTSKICNIISQNNK
jgi:hypothetical protein